MNQNTLNTIDVAWAAGLFEGEGCISIAGATVVLHLGMTDYDVVAKFATAIGSSPTRVREVQSMKHKTMYRWSIGQRPETDRILHLLLPYLGDRRRAKAIEALSLPPQTKPRHSNG